MSITDGNGVDVSTVADHIANVNPIRYRSYYYDRETNLYYLESRYYDPETGRFLNADNLGYMEPETIQGANLYAYCGNNPVMRTDSTGHAWWNPFSWDWKGAINKAWKATKTFFEDFISDCKNYGRNNNSIQTVYDSRFFSAYEGITIIRFPSSKIFSSFAIGNVIFLEHDKTRRKGDPIKTTHINTLKHEYGHTLQYDALGLVKYVSSVAIPSVTANILDKMGKLPYDYYGAPWEAEADVLGDVSRNGDNTPWPTGAYNSYWDLLKMFFD